MKKITVGQWVEERGVKEAVLVCDVDTSTARNWQRGFVLPDSRNMIKIRRHTKGQVSIDLTVDHHFSAKNKARFIGVTESKK